MDEDDLDFTPNVNSSRLASLFGINKPTTSGNSSLIYTAPKQPKKESSPSKSPVPSDEKQVPKFEVLLTKRVEAHKLENGAYVNLGTVGITIVGSHSAHLYHIILYSQNKQTISKTKISRRFLFKVSDNNYATFYDETNQAWSVMFTSSNDIIQFAKQIAVAAYNSTAEPLTDILIQNLTPGVGTEAKYSNSVDIVYNLLVVKNEKTSLLRENLTETIHLAEEDETWTKGLLSCCDKSQRIIIVPHSLSALWQSEAPSDSDLFVEVKVEQVTTLSDSAGKRSANKIKKSEDSGDSPFDSSAEDSNIKARGASIKEALSSTKSHKANLISRMARMGQPTLPLKGALPCGPSDSEEESSVSSSPKVRTPRNRVAPATAISHTPAIPHIQDKIRPGQSVAVYQSDIWQPQHQQQQQQQLARAGMNLAYQQLIPVSASPLTSPTTDLSVYISESRTQATELRMGISKVSDKIDHVLNKMQDLSINSQDRSKGPVPASLDPTGILTSIQTLVTDNENLKEKVEEQKTKIDQQNDRIFNLLELNQKYLEKNISDQDKLTERELKLQSQVNLYQEKESQLEIDNSKAVEKVKKLENEISSLNTSNTQLREQINRLNEEIIEYKTEVENSKKSLSEKTDYFKKNEANVSEIVKTNEGLNDKISELTSTNAALEESLSLLKEELKNSDAKVQSLNNELGRVKNELKNENAKLQSISNNQDSTTEIIVEELSNTIKQLREENQVLIKKSEATPPLVNSDVVEEVKKAMNVVYRSLQTQFNDKQNYDGVSIKRTLATTIRDVTLEYLNYAASQEKPEATEETPTVSNLETEPEQKLELEQKQVEKSQPEPELETPLIMPERSVPKVEKQEEPLKKTQEDSVADRPNGSETLMKENVSNPEIKNEDHPSNSTGLDKSYDQNWRPAKPPPPPLFEDDDDDDDWLK